MGDLYNDLVTEALVSDLAQINGIAKFMTKYRPVAGRKDFFVQFTERPGADKRLVGQALENNPFATEDSQKASAEIPQLHPPGSGPKRTGTPVSPKDAERMKPGDAMIFAKPAHDDPTGVYTYPLEYVINHFSSIPYGMSMPYLRVIRLRPGAKVLDLQSLTKDSAIKLLEKMGVFEETPRPGFIEKIWKQWTDIVTQRMAPATAPKVFFQIAQNLDTSPVGGVLSNNKQAARFLKAGITAIQDTAPNKAAAVIHSNEPEQVIFLRRDAFDVVDVFQTAKAIQSSPTDNPRIIDWTKVSGRIASKILTAVDPNDQIVRVTKVLGDGLETLLHPFPLSGKVKIQLSAIAFTKAGRAISVESQGEKTVEGKKTVPEHRQGSPYSGIEYQIQMLDETGHQKTMIDPKESVDQAARRMAMIRRRQPAVADWRPLRGENEAAHMWRVILQRIPTAVRTGGSYSPDTEVDITRAQEDAPETMEDLTKLLSNVGWRWEAPKDPWDQIAAWAVAQDFMDSLAWARNKSYGEAMDAVRKQSEKMRTGDYRPMHFKPNDIKKLEGTPVEKPAKALLASTCNKDFMAGYDYIISLLHGLDALYHKRWLVMKNQNGFKLSIGRLVEDTEPKKYEEKLHDLWKRTSAHAPGWGEFNQLSTQKLHFLEDTGEHPRIDWLAEKKQTAVTEAEVNEVIIGTQFSTDGMNSGNHGGATPARWKQQGQELQFSEPKIKPSQGLDPRIARVKRAVETITKRTLTWNRDPSTGSETAYIGNGRKVRVGLNDVTPGPKVLAINALKPPKNLRAMLG